MKLELNIIDIFNIIKADCKKLILWVFCGCLVGIVVAFSIPKEYKCTVVLAPEESGAGFMGSVSSLASLVGMDMKLGTTGDAIYPEIYPDVIGSSDFLVGLFSVPVTTKDKTYSSDYATYLKKKTKSPWWNYPKKCLAGVIAKLKGGDDASYTPGKALDPFQLSKGEYDLMQGINANISCLVDKKTNVISITVADQDPYIAACMADTVTARLQRLITDYRTKKSREDVEYLVKIHSESLAKYKKAQGAYAAYAEGHRGTVLETINQRQEKLKNDMDLAQNIYATVSEQLELAKAKVQEKTPAFTTIQSATVPVKHSNTPKVVVMAMFMMLAFSARCLTLLYRNINKFIVK